MFNLHSLPVYIKTTTSKRGSTQKINFHYAASSMNNETWLTLKAHHTCSQEWGGRLITVLLKKKNFIFSHVYTQNSLPKCCLRSFF